MRQVVNVIDFYPSLLHSNACMNRCVVVFLIAFSFSFVQAEISPQLENIVQQLDWDMTRIGKKGNQARVRAITKLTCIGQRSLEERSRVLQTAGRLLGHENPMIVNAALTLFNNLYATQEIISYHPTFRLRHAFPDTSEVQSILNYILNDKYEGIEIINEFYPQRVDDVLGLNSLASLFEKERGTALKIRLRIFSSYEPTPYENNLISSIAGEVIRDFHIGPLVPTDSACY